MFGVSVNPDTASEDPSQVRSEEAPRFPESLNWSSPCEPAASTSVLETDAVSVYSPVLELNEKATFPPADSKSSSVR